MLDWLVAILLALALGGPSGAGPPKPPSDLDRIAVAVEGVESGHGADPAMWRRNAAGPQGPMQVSAAAAADVGGGNRFAAEENRTIGRAYLALMYRRYGDWPDAVAAYNWGPANLDRWIAAGRPTSGLTAALRAYLDRVRGEFFLTAGPAPVRAPPVAVAPDPPAVAIRDPALRKIYLSDRVAIARLREFLAASSAGDSAADAGVVLATMRSVSTRRGYEEFARAGTPAAGPASPAALKQIAAILVAKLQAECAAIVLVDGKRHPQRAP
jgi:hypothetical protein